MYTNTNIQLSFQSLFIWNISRIKKNKILLLSTYILKFFNSIVEKIEEYHIINCYIRGKVDEMYSDEILFGKYNIKFIKYKVVLLSIWLATMTRERFFKVFFFHSQMKFHFFCLLKRTTWIKNLKIFGVINLTNFS